MRAFTLKTLAVPSAISMVFLLATTTLSLADPPARVGRLSYIEGTVSFHTKDQQEWSYASQNYPITTGDAFWTEANARSELEVGPAEIRMDNGTELDVLRLDDTGIQFEVPQGDINVHLAQVPEGGVQVNTPNGQIILNQPGSYHIDSGHPQGDSPAPQAEVTVLEGSAQIAGAENAEVMQGERATLSGNPPEVTLAEGNSTPFDDWALSREKREQPHQATQYVSPQTTGYQDLDTYGQWSQAPQYGTVWYPQAVPVGWAPYRYGHWAFIEPWGWTWVDDAPWGFAPFHYGRWIQIGPRWAWCPGEIAPRPVYAPALVAFVGGGGFGVSVGIGAGPVGWIPLAPFEPFHPYYHTSPEYLRNVNIHNVHETTINNITINNGGTVNHFANARAVTAVSSADFTRGAAVRSAQVSIPQSQLAHATVMSDVSHLQPTATARRGGFSAHPQGAAPHPEALRGVNAVHSPRAVQPAATPAVRTQVPQANVTSSVHNGAPGPDISRHEAIMNRAQATHEANVRAGENAEATPRIVRGAGESTDVRPAGAQRTYPEAVQKHTVRSATVAQPAERAVTHPVQQTRIAPTPKGWVRQPKEKRNDAPHEDKHAPGPSNEKRQ